MLAKKRTQLWLCSLFVLPRRTRTVSLAMLACAKRAPAELCAEGASPAGARRIHKIRAVHGTTGCSDLALFKAGVRFYVYGERAAVAFPPPYACICAGKQIGRKKFLYMTVSVKYHMVSCARRDNKDKSHGLCALRPIIGERAKGPPHLYDVC